MFKALRQRLSVGNFIVIGLIVLLIVALSAIGLFRAFPNTIDAVLWEAAYTGRLPDGYAPEETSNLLILHMNDAGEMTDAQARWDLPENTDTIARAVLENASDKGRILLEGGGEYLFLRLKHEGGAVAALREVPATAQQWMDALPETLLFAVLVLLILYGASWFIAGRAASPLLEAWAEQREYMEYAIKTLRNTIVRMESDVLRAGEDISDEEALRARLRSATREGQEAARLSDNFLQMLAGNDDWLIPFNLSETVENSARRWIPVAENRDLRFDIDVQPSLFCMGRSEDIARLMDIFLEFAIEQTKPAGKVTLVLREHKKAARLMVEDTGAGMSAEQLQQIFTVEGAKGAVPPDRRGIFIALQIVQRFGGDMQVRSAPGEGSCFTVNLPMAFRRAESDAPGT